MGKVITYIAAPPQPPFRLCFRMRHEQRIQPRGVPAVLADDEPDLGFFAAGEPRFELGGYGGLEGRADRGWREDADVDALYPWQSPLFSSSSPRR